MSTEKDPRLVASGRDGARRRWGAPRHVDLRTVDPVVAAAIRALVAADEAAKAAAHKPGQS